jgi:hypothetical protein
VSHAGSDSGLSTKKVVCLFGFRNKPFAKSALLLRFHNTPCDLQNRCSELPLRTKMLCLFGLCNRTIEFLTPGSIGSMLRVQFLA